MYSEHNNDLFATYDPHGRNLLPYHALPPFLESNYFGRISRIIE
jgi:hypothetical protein